jgi:flagellar motor protein MotB
MTTRARRILLIAMIGWLGLALMVLFVGPTSIGALEQQLEANAREALDARELEWAQVTVKGQVATLTGAAPSNTARNEAIFTTLGSTWSGGVVAGGISRVVDETSDARSERSFAFRADLLNGRVNIRGDATDADARTAITQYANANFPAGADTDLTLIPGGAMSAEWESAATRLLGQLARLDRGAASLKDAQGGLIGDAANPQIAQSVSIALASMPGEYMTAVLIKPAGAPAVIRIPDAAGCQAIIRAAQGGVHPRFDLGGATPNPSSAVLLRRVGEVFAACPDTARLSVLIGIENDNTDLAAERATSVLGLLVAGGADEAKLDVSLTSDPGEIVTISTVLAEG